MTISSPLILIEIPDVKNARSILDAARLERDQLNQAASTAWKQYQIFCDEDPRWEDPACPWEKLEIFYNHRDRLRINAELADQAYFSACSKFDQAHADLISFLGEEE